ncbi:MAG: hypothetical protein IJH39_09260 [Clostridia bacterium]|nr:hypothetical protein [Clostridia bacterium]
MAKKKSNLLSSFEETCMWMSWRYAIGRNSIASVMHAHDIAMNTFWRQTIERKEFNAFDIAREIDSQLRFPFNFYIDYPNVNENYHPLERFMEFLKNENIHNLEDLNNYKSVKYTRDGKFDIKMYPYVDAYHSNPEGDKQEAYYDNPNPRHISDMDIDDLIPWQKLAATFDVKRLLVAHTEYEGKEEDIICFKSYIKTYGEAEAIDLQGNPYKINDVNNITYEEVYVPLDKYLTFGGENYRIADEYIKSIRLINEEEIKKFEVE